jgi:hypothetical protein
MEGILSGGSSGAIVCAAMRAAKGLKEGQNCVVLLPDGVRNYLSKFLSDEWMLEKGYIDKAPVYEKIFPKKTFSIKDVYSPEAAPTAAFQFVPEPWPQTKYWYYRVHTIELYIL